MNPPYLLCSIVQHWLTTSNHSNERVSSKWSRMRARQAQSLVALTKAGRAKLAQSIPIWEEAQRRFESAFGEERARVVRATLDYIASPEFARRLDCK